MFPLCKKTFIKCKNVKRGKIFVLYKYLKLLVSNLVTNRNFPSLSGYCYDDVSSMFIIVSGLLTI